MSEPAAAGSSVTQLGRSTRLSAADPRAKSKHVTDMMLSQSQRMRFYDRSQGSLTFPGRRHSKSAPWSEIGLCLHFLQSLSHVHESPNSLSQQNIEQIDSNSPYRCLICRREPSPESATESPQSRPMVPRSLSSPITSTRYFIEPFFYGSRSDEKDAQQSPATHENPHSIPDHRGSLDFALTSFSQLQWKQDSESADWFCSIPSQYELGLDDFLHSKRVSFRHLPILSTGDSKMTFYSPDPPSAEWEKCTDLHFCLTAWFSQSCEGFGPTPRPTPLALAGPTPSVHTGDVLDSGTSYSDRTIHEIPAPSVASVTMTPIVDQTRGSLGFVRNREENVESTSAQSHHADDSDSMFSPSEQTQGCAKRPKTTQEVSRDPEDLPDCDLSDIEPKMVETGFWLEPARK